MVATATAAVIPTTMTPATLSQTYGEAPRREGCLVAGAYQVALEWRKAERNLEALNTVEAQWRSYLGLARISGSPKFARSKDCTNLHCPAQGGAGKGMAGACVYACAGAEARARVLRLAA